jgi:folate-binding protein YgfZ
MAITYGYRALRETAAWFDLSARGRLKATGEDRKRLLHALTTNHVEGLEPGHGVYAFFLNAQGRVLADAIVACRAQDLLISTEPETREKVARHIEGYIIADDVTLEDMTATTCEMALEGPDAASRLVFLELPVPHAEYGSMEADGITVLRASMTGQPGFRLIGPASRKDELESHLAAFAPAAGADDVRAVRLENGRPRYGEDISERYIAHETGQMQALHFQKGCYLGQEIVERVRSRGLVHRQLRALRIEGQTEPEPGEKVLAGEKEVGEITSAAWSPAENAIRALAYLRLDAGGGAELRTAGGQAAQIVEDRGRHA